MFTLAECAAKSKRLVREIQPEKTGFTAEDMECTEGMKTRRSLTTDHTDFTDRLVKAPDASAPIRVIRAIRG
jgi:hypothetical protein